ncbi:MAG: type I-F CRISPR-associated protein Csy1 [Pseudomonas sp.]|nr:type I-F CRISPR-associated protein Csy1 [Pseudomonas sp.]
MLDEHQRTFARAVHFSFKTTNSNASSGGVRVDVEDALDLPYLSARTLLAEGQRLELDYTINSNGAPQHFKHMRQALEPLQDAQALAAQQHNAEKQAQKAAKTGKTLPEKKTAGPTLSVEELAAVAQLFQEQTAGHFELHCNAFIDPRMRQLLLPRKSKEGNTEYLSISPLTAAGLCNRTTQQVEQTNERTQQAKEKAKEKTEPEHKPSTRRIMQARNALVGSNPQNVGGLVWKKERQSPIYCQAPVTALDARTALAIHHRGPHLAIPQHRLQNYAHFLRRISDEGVRVTNADLRAEEIDLLTAMMDDVQAQARQARYLLEEHQHLFPVDATGTRPLFSPKVAAVLVGWVLPEWRDASWKQQAAIWMKTQMRTATIKNAQQQEIHLVPLDGYGLREVAHLLEGIL